MNCPSWTLTPIKATWISTTSRWSCRRRRTSKEYELFRVGYLEAEGPGPHWAVHDSARSGTGRTHSRHSQEGEVSRIDVTLKPDADLGQVRAELAKRIGERANVRTPDEQNESLHNAMSGMQNLFSLNGVAALVVGVFLVYNVLSVTVAERRHEIGILLAVGATRWQVRALFAGEAALLGLTGSLLAIPLGLGLAMIGLAADAKNSRHGWKEAMICGCS